MRRKATRALPALSRRRLIRLFRFLKLVEKSALKREQIMKRLQLDIRGFYRDLETLRQLKISIKVGADHRYHLQGTLEEALQHLPFPDPQLTFSEVALLIQGDTPAHNKLRKQWEALVGERGSDKPASDPDDEILPSQSDNGNSPSLGGTINPSRSEPMSVPATAADE
ncbi:MAG: hypothetical protein NZ703_01955 [Gemmataceae bacterium]|nr:hypothetical protein [Gemmataceae bacterium]MCS7269823.1 hypothetical protein [Gemmataceae bacterium]MDW8243823.1 hypothetical protein [Thermogemmata sp.]